MTVPAPPSSIGLVVHSGRPEAADVVIDAASRIRARGMQPVVAADAELPSTMAKRLAREVELVDAERFARTVDLAVSLGGDGTFLRAAHLCRDAGAPIFGVNLGRLGFLNEIEIEDLDRALAAIAEGSFVVDQRTTIDVVKVDADGQERARGWALNEVAIEKTARQRLLHMEVHIDGQLFAHVPADALVVATATGSTAYALSAGGPIVSPRVEGTLVVPVAAHSLFDRTVMVAPDERIDVFLTPQRSAAVASCDGRDPVELAPGSRVTVYGGGTPVAAARLLELEFYGLVRRKFHLR